MTTIILAVSAETGFYGSFLMNHSTGTIGEARAWFAEVAEGMAKARALDSNETLYGVTFAAKTLAEIERAFPHLFASDWLSPWDCNDGGSTNE